MRQRTDRARRKLSRIRVGSQGIGQGKFSLTGRHFLRLFTTLARCIVGPMEGLHRSTRIMSLNYLIVRIAHLTLAVSFVLAEVLIFKIGAA